MKPIYSRISKVLFALSCIMLMHFGSYATLSGNYTIDPTSAASATNYQNWASAIGDLLTGSRTDGGTAQGPGVSAAVTFTVKDQVYSNTQISITTITGASSINTITFKSTSDSSKCVLQYPSGTTATDDYVLKLDGADYITFNKIGFERTGSNAYYTVVRILNDADRNSFTRCWMKTRKLPVTVSGGWTSGIGALIFFEGNGDSTMVLQNKMIYGFNGVYGAIACTGNTFLNNVIDTSGSIGIYMTQQTNMKITGNYFRMGDFGTGLGHQISYAIRIESSPALVITKNNIIMLATNAATVRAMVLVYITGTATARSMVNNNLIINSGGSSSVSGISLYAINYLDLYYNNVLITSPFTAGSVLHENALYANTFVEMKNNNFINKGGGLVFDLQSTTHNFDTVENNNYFTSGSVFAKWTSGVSYSNFAAWKTGTGKDATSLNIDPGFVSNKDLHVTSIGVAAKGTPYWAVKDDYDGQLRNATTPCIGADEFFPAQRDAGLSRIDSPIVFCPGLKNVKVSFQNYGIDTLKNLKINWQINGVTQTQYSWTGKVDPGSTSSSILLGNYNFLPNTAYNFKVWTSTPNGSTDGNNLNDTLKVTRYAGLAGTYTIGTAPSDFTTFNAALAALSSRGVCGATTFNVKDGTYNEQLTMLPFSGMGATNPVVFQAINNDSSKVVITMVAGSATGNNNSILQLNAVTYVTYKKITFLRTGTLQICPVLHIVNGASNNTFYHCQMIGTNYASISVTTYNIFSDAGVNNNNSFIGNYVKLGSMSMMYPGTVAAHQTGTVIQGNVFDSAYNSAVQLQYNDKVVIKGNTFRNIRTTATGNFDLALFDCDSANQVIGNYFNDSNTNVGIGLTGGCTATSANPGLIANNFINKPYGAGISIDGADYQNVVFNSIYMRNPVTTNVGIITTSSTSTNTVIKNNNVMAEAGYALYVNVATQVSASNRNNFFTKGSQFVSYGGTAYSTLAAYSTATSMDVNSLSVNPLFVSSSDLHITNTALNNAGEPITGITTDIDGQTRNVTTPSIGADEIVSSGLIGAYTINPKLAATNKNYKNWASAIGDLLSGSRTDGGPVQGSGITGAVTFTVYDTVYLNTQVLLTAIKGASAINTVTFKSTADSSKCVLQYPSGTTSADDYVLMLNGVKYVTFSKIGFQRTGTNSFGTVVQITGAATNNTITHCFLRALKTPSTLSNGFAYGIGSCIYFTGNGDSTTISQNMMWYGYNGIYNATSATGIKILNNIIDTAGGSGVFMGNQTNLLISGNSINMGDFGVGSNQYVSYAMRIEASPSVVITKNKCILSAVNAQVSRALIVYQTTSTAAQPALITNNFIVNSGGTGSCTGLSIYGAAYSHWDHNNVLILGTVAGGSALFLNTFAGSPVEILNNNLINKGGTLVIDANGTNYTDIDTCNFNNGYTTGATFGNWNGSPVTTAALWKTTTSKDANSVNFDPGYVSNTNLHVTNAAINNKGKYYFRVKDDIDGDIRNVTTPDIGADEFSITNEAGITAITAPVNNSCPGVYPVKAVIKNFGEDTLKKATIVWSVGGVFKIPFSWTGSVLPQKTDTITLATLPFTGGTNYTIMVRSTMPNGKTDINSTNDSIKVVKTIRPLPTANAGVDQAVCLGDSVLIGPATTTGYSYKWYDATNNVIATTSQFYYKPATPITLYFEVKNTSTQCVNTDTINIKTYPKPVPNAGSDQTICEGLSVTIGTTAKTGFSYTWASLPSGFVSYSADTTIVPKTTTTYIVKMKNDLTSCFAYDTTLITVDMLPTPKIVGDTAVCEGSTLTYSTALTTGSSYNWKVTAGNIVSGQGTETVDIKWSTAGTGMIEVVEENAANCKDSSMVNIVVSLNPKAKFGYIASCSGSLSRFIDSSSNANSRIWDFGDGQTATSADTTHSYSVADTYTVKLKVFSAQGCIDSTIQTVIIVQAPKADFTIDTKACAGKTIAIANKSTDATSYFWNLGNSQTSNLTTPTAYSYTTSGTYNVKLVAYGALGCKDSLTKTVTVNPNPVAKFGITQKANKTIDFTDSSTISSGSIVAWKWHFGDGDSSILQNPSHQYASTTSYNVDLCVTSAEGCVNCITKSIPVLTGISQSTFDKSLALYPNPSYGQFIVKSTKQFDLIEVTNLLGKVVEVVKPQSNSVTIDISTQPKGVYFVKMSSENQSTVIRISKL